MSSLCKSPCPRYCKPFSWGVHKPPKPKKHIAVLQNLNTRHKCYYREMIYQIQSITVFYCLLVLVVHFTSSIKAILQLSLLTSETIGRGTYAAEALTLKFVCSHWLSPCRWPGGALMHIDLQHWGCAGLWLTRLLLKISWCAAQAVGCCCEEALLWVLSLPPLNRAWVKGLEPEPQAPQVCEFHRRDAEPQRCSGEAREMQRNWSLSGHYSVVVDSNVTLSCNQQGKPTNSDAGDVKSKHSEHQTTAHSDHQDSAQPDQTLSLPHSVCRISVAKHHKREH